MGLISWFINQLITGGPHPVRLNMVKSNFRQLENMWYPKMLEKLITAPPNYTYLYPNVSTYIYIYVYKIPKNIYTYTTYIYNICLYVCICIYIYIYSCFYIVFSHILPARLRPAAGCLGVGGHCRRAGGAAFRQGGSPMVSLTPKGLYH